MFIRKKSELFSDSNVFGYSLSRKGLFLVNWEAFTAISTFTAVLTALFIHFFQFFYQKKARLRVHLVTKGKYSESMKVYIVVSNIGLVSETIEQILIIKKDGRIIEPISKDVDLPKTLNPYSVVQLDNLYIEKDLDNIEKIFIVDSRGKRWICKKKSIENSKRLLKKYIGKRISYPSMGDKNHEN